MKTTLTLLSILFVYQQLFSQTTTIPDINFEKALIDLGYDSGTPDGTVPTANISAVITLNVTQDSISDLTGIEDFTSLKYLYCSYNSLSNLDVSNNTELRRLWCSTNSLSTLDLSKNTRLVELKCSENLLNILDFSMNTLITKLECNSNTLNSLNISTNTLLKHLDCRRNSLSALNVSSNTLLNFLYCYNNFLNTLDVPNNSMLVSLYCGQNSLSVLDVSNNTRLSTLNCYKNKLSNLDLSNNPQLTGLSCQENSLFNLNIKNGNNTNMNLLCTYNNSNLFCITVDDPSYSIHNWPVGAPYRYLKDHWSNYTSEICGNNPISGIVYFDKNQNCIQDSEEQGLRNVVIKAKGSNSFYVTTNDTGYYKFRVDTNEIYQLTIESLPANELLNSYCPNSGHSIPIGISGIDTTNVNFGVNLKEVFFSISRYY